MSCAPRLSSTARPRERGDGGVVRDSTGLYPVRVFHAAEKLHGLIRRSSLNKKAFIRGKNNYLSENLEKRKDEGPDESKLEKANACV